MPDDSTLVLAEESPFGHIAHPRKRAMLTAYRETANVRLAAELAETSTTSHYRWLKEDREYEKAFGIAEEDAADLLEAEAYRRAVKGVEKPVGWYKGEAGGHVVEYSDTLLIFLLKGARPEKFADRLDVRGAIANMDVSQLPDPVLARIANGEDPRVALASYVEERESLPVHEDGALRVHQEGDGGEDGHAAQ